MGNTKMTKAGFAVNSGLAIIGAASVAGIPGSNWMQTSPLTATICLCLGVATGLIGIVRIIYALFKTNG